MMIGKEKDSNPCEHYSTFACFGIATLVCEWAFSGGLIVVSFFQWQAEVCLLVDKLKHIDMDTIENDLEKDNMTGTNHTGKFPNKPVKFLTATTIIGDNVYNLEDESLGEIKDIMLDIRNGRIEYVVIEFGGFLGIGEKFFAVPFRALTIDTTRHAFVLDQSKEVLKKAPGFDKDHWPETNSRVWGDSTTYWGGFMGPNTGSVPY
jgi:sporulation protein YlmC with PRC-barrel domain